MEDVKNETGSINIHRSLHVCSSLADDMQGIAGGEPIIKMIYTGLGNNCHAFFHLQMEGILTQPILLSAIQLARKN